MAYANGESGKEVFPALDSVLEFLAAAVTSILDARIKN